MRWAVISCKLPSSQELLSQGSVFKTNALCSQSQLLVKEKKKRKDFW